MDKIEDKCTFSLHLDISVDVNVDISVPANHALIGALTGSVENVLLLPYSMFRIIRPIDPKPLPDIGDHPVPLLPAKHQEALVRFLNLYEIWGRIKSRIGESVCRSLPNFLDGSTIRQKLGVLLIEQRAGLDAPVSAKAPASRSSNSFE